MSEERKISKNSVCIDNTAKNDVTDKYNLVYIFIFLMGMVHFIPWSFFTTFTEYWMYKFRNTTLDNQLAEDRTTLQSIFTASINTALAISAFVFFVVTIRYGHYIKLKPRLFLILGVMLASFLLLTAFVLIDTDSYQTAFLVLVLALVTLVNAINAFLSVSMYTIISRFPSESSKYVAIYVMSYPMSKIFTSLVEIASHLLGLGVVDSAFVYFLIGVCVIFFAGCWTYYIVNYNEYYKTHMVDLTETNENALSISTLKYFGKKMGANFIALSFVTLLNQILPQALIVSEFETQGQWPDVFFIPTICFLMVSASDWIGRLCTVKLPQLKLGKYQFIIVCFLTLIIFYPLTFFCNAQPRPRETPVIFKHDYQCIIILICCNFCQGYLLNLASLNIPKLVKEEELKLAYHTYLIIAGSFTAVAAPVSLLTVSLL